MDDAEDDFEKTVIRGDTVKVDVDPNYRVPPCLVLLSGPAQLIGRQWPIDHSGMIMGRMNSADIHIPEPSLSKMHAQFDIEDGKVTITDLASTNGTLVNKDNLIPNRPRLLKNNDQILGGSVVFKYLEHGIVSETAEKERMQSELEMARTVQESMLPKQREAHYGSMHLAGRYRSATECGGDWWWHWSCANHAFAIIADATGHGAGAALLTSAARSTIAAIEQEPSARVENVYHNLTRAVRLCSGGKLLMSAFIVEVELQTRKIRFVNASHVSALILPKSDGASRPLQWNSIPDICDPISPALGNVDENCQTGSAEMPPRSRLVLLTDGLIERPNAEGKPLRLRIFNELLIHSHQANLNSPEEFLDDLMRRSDDLSGATAQSDDITIVTLDFD